MKTLQIFHNYHSKNTILLVNTHFYFAGCLCSKHLFPPIHQCSIHQNVRGNTTQEKLIN